MYKLLIADDARISREGLKKTISWENFGITVVGLAKDGFEAYEMIRLHAPDIVISDIRMPGLNGIELLENPESYFPALYLSFYQPTASLNMHSPPWSWG